MRGNASESVLVQCLDPSAPAAVRAPAVRRSRAEIKVRVQSAVYVCSVAD